MKNTFFMMALLCLASIATAQTTFGIKTFYGVSYTDQVSEQYVESSLTKVLQLGYIKSEPRKGIGVTMLNQNDKVFVMSEVGYMSSGQTFAVQAYGTSGTLLDPATTYRNTSSSLRGSVMAGVNLKKLKLGVGPEISYNLSEEESLSTFSNTLEYASRKYNTGFNFLIGYKLNKHIHLDLRHTYIFQDVSDGYKFEGVPLDIGRNAKYLELSVSFFL